jgi:hypothetical protein
VETIPIADLGKYGLTGTILGIALWALWAYKTDLASCWKERLADWKSMQEIVSQMTVAINSFTTATDARTRAQEAAARAQEAQATTIAALNIEVARLKDLLVQR